MKMPVGTGLLSKAKSQLLTFAFCSTEEEMFRSSLASFDQNVPQTSKALSRVKLIIQASSAAVQLVIMNAPVSGKLLLIIISYQHAHNI